MTDIDITPRQLALHLAISLGIPLALLDDLHLLHAQQWTLEDQSRSEYATPEQIAQTKSRIDASNSLRHKMINAIDAALALRPSAPPPRFYSETVGELCDRLLIFDLKYHALADSSGVRRVCHHLAVVTDQLIADIASGRAALPPRVGVKIYNGAASEGA